MKKKSNPSPPRNIRPEAPPGPPLTEGNTLGSMSPKESPKNRLSPKGPPPKPTPPPIEVRGEAEKSRRINETAGNTIAEGRVNKGGVNPPPTATKPDLSPPGQGQPTIITNREIYQEALEHWGETLQLDMVQEECAELIAAISKIKRFPDDSETIDNLIEEVADVQIMLEQAKLIVGEKKVAHEITRKLTKLRKLLTK